MLGLLGCHTHAMAEEVRSRVQTKTPTGSELGLSTGNAQDDGRDGSDNIVVTAALRRGAVDTAIPAEITVERAVIRALGVSNLSEVVNAFAAQGHSLRSQGEPILLLDGRRIGSRSEIAELPPEAILRIEIFPEEVATRYGYPSDRRVFNVILRPRFRSIELQARFDVPVGIGRQSYSAKVHLLRMTPERRLNASLGYQRQTALVDRSSGDGPDIRWRLPDRDRISTNGTYFRHFNGLDATVSATGHWQLEQWRLGRLPAGLDSGLSPGLSRREIQVQSRLGVTIGAKTAHWLWSASGAFQLQSDRIITHNTAGTLAPVPGYSVNGATREAQLEFTASGSPGQLSSGQIITTFGGGLNSRRHDSNDRFVGGPRSEVRQSSAFAFASLDIPLVRNEGAVVSLEGRLTAASAQHPLGRYGFGLRATPMEGLTFGASFSHDRRLPDFISLAETQTVTPNVRVYDFAIGNTGYVERLDGGNPDLQPPLVQISALRIQFKPPSLQELSISLDYSRTSLFDGISGRLEPTPQVEAAYPERFERNSLGSLVRFDRRPLNIAREDRRQLRWGINLAAPIAGQRGTSQGAITGAGNPVQTSPQFSSDAPPRHSSSTGGTGAPQLQFALYHTWTLKDTATLRAGSPPTNLLGGGAISNVGDVARHRLEAQLGYVSRTLGIRLSGNWSSNSEVHSATLLANRTGHHLKLQHAVKVDIRVFIDLEKDRNLTGLRWLSGRFYLEIDNLLGSRARIANENGASLDFYRGSNEEVGRTIHLTFRKGI